MLLRGIGLVYAVAFLILVRQGPALIGEHGILPVVRFLNLVAGNLGSRGAGFWQLPSLFWFSASDTWLQACAWLGLCGALTMLAGFSNAPLLALLWALYLSFCHIGQIFYGYGWDSLLCETGFLAIIGLSCFDDQLVLRVVPNQWRELLRTRMAQVAHAEPSRYRRAVSIVLAVVIAVLSLNPVVNLLSPRQAMNASFEPFNLVNTYGAFGSVSRERYEVVIEGTAATRLDQRTKWLEYALPCQPGRVGRRPCLATPYHYRLDWQLWFVPLSPEHQRRWFLSLTHKLLQGDARVLALFAENPFPKRPPHYIRASFYRYQFAPLGGHDTWHRTAAGQYLPPTALDDPEFVEALRAYRLSD